MALSDGKLVLRDLTKMMCLDVRGGKAMQYRHVQTARIGGKGRARCAASRWTRTGNSMPAGDSEIKVFDGRPR
jgi:hypothetical protein